MERNLLAMRLKSLVLFPALRKEPLIAALGALLACQDAAQAASCVCDVAAALYPAGADLTEAVLSLVLSDDNAYMRHVGAGKKPAPQAEAWLQMELAVLEEAASVTVDTVRSWFPLTQALPEWTVQPLDFAGAYRNLLENLGTRGYGIYARSHVFTVSRRGRILPVKNPDTQRLEDLRGYERERRMVLQNTWALLRGLPANNMLLYGDAGTGKSSTVKAIANAYKDHGLRLIQVDKDKLHTIPGLLDTLGENPLKFILFIDDLSFTEEDQNFTALKTMLEGNVAARPENIVVYATSNRRHLIKETFSARAGDEVHRNDTLEEMSSLAARFGLLVTFEKPGKDAYLSLVESFAAESGLTLEREALKQDAEAFAIRSGGRSPRTAKQYIEYKIASMQEEI